MSYKKRIDTLRVLIDGHPLLKGSPHLTAITGEANRIVHAGRLGTDRGWLLSVLHTTRTLDTTMQELCSAKSWVGKQSLGGYLKTIALNRPSLTRVCNGYQKTIVDPRNKYMHRAGTHPQHLEADRILSEMQSCVAVLLAQIT